MRERLRTCHSSPGDLSEYRRQLLQGVRQNNQSPRKVSYKPQVRGRVIRKWRRKGYGSLKFDTVTTQTDGTVKSDHPKPSIKTGRRARATKAAAVAMTTG